MSKQVKSNAPSNLTPIAGAAQAGVAGMDNEKIAGVRLGQAFIKADREKAEAQAKEGESLKDRLIKLVKLTKPEHEAFCATLNEEREALKARAKAAGFDTLDKYFKTGGRNGQVDYYLQTSISLWMKFSAAMQKGWPISPDRIKASNWQALSKEATDYKPTQPAQAPSMQTDTEKQAQRLAEQKKVIDDAAKFAEQHLTKRNEQGNLALSDAAKSALPDAVMTMCKWASVEEVDAIIAKLQQYREVIVKAREEAAKATAKAAAKSDTAEPTANVGDKEPAPVAAAAKPKSKARRVKA